MGVCEKHLAHGKFSDKIWCPKYGLQAGFQTKKYGMYIPVYECCNIFSNLSSDTPTELNKYQQTNNLSTKLSKSTPNSTVTLSLNSLKYYSFVYGTRLHITVQAYYFENLCFPFPCHISLRIQGIFTIILCADPAAAIFSGIDHCSAGSYQLSFLIRSYVGSYQLCLPDVGSYQSCSKIGSC